MLLNATLTSSIQGLVKAILLDMQTFHSKWGQFLVCNKPIVCVI